MKIKVTGISAQTSRKISFRSASKESAAVDITLRDENKIVNLSGGDPMGNLGVSSEVANDVYAIITPRDGYKIASVTYSSSLTTTPKVIKASAGEYKIPKEAVDAQEVVISTIASYSVNGKSGVITKCTVNPYEEYTFGLLRGDIEGGSGVIIASATLTDKKKNKISDVLKIVDGEKVTIAKEALLDYAGQTLTLELTSDEKSTLVVSGFTPETSAKSAKATLTILPANCTSITVTGVKSATLKQPVATTRKYQIKLSKGSLVENVFVDPAVATDGYTFSVTPADEKGNIYLQVQTGFDAAEAGTDCTLYYDPKGKQESYTTEALEKLTKFKFKVVADTTDIKTIKPTVAVTAVSDVDASIKITNNKKNLNDALGIYYVVKATRVDAANISAEDKAALDAKMKPEVYAVVGANNNGLATCDLVFAVAPTDHTKCVGNVKYAITASAVQSSTVPVVTSKAQFDSVVKSADNTSKAVNAVTKNSAYTTKLTLKARKVTLFNGMKIDSEGVEIADAVFDKNCTYQKLTSVNIDAYEGFFSKPNIAISEDGKSIVLKSYPAKSSENSTFMVISATADGAGFEGNIVTATIKISGYTGLGYATVDVPSNFVYKPVNKAVTFQTSLTGYPKQAVVKTEYACYSLNENLAKYVSISNKGKVTIAKNALVDKENSSNNEFTVHAKVTTKDGLVKDFYNTIKISEKATDIKLSLELNDGTRALNNQTVDVAKVYEGFLIIEGDIEGDIYYDRMFKVTGAKNGVELGIPFKRPGEDFYRVRIDATVAGTHTFTVTMQDGSKKSSKFTIKTKYGSEDMKLYLSAEGEDSSTMTEDGVSAEEGIVLKKNEPLVLNIKGCEVPNNMVVEGTVVSVGAGVTSLPAKPTVKGAKYYLDDGNQVEGYEMIILPTASKFTINLGKGYSVVVNIVDYKTKNEVTTKTTKFNFATNSMNDPIGVVKVPLNIPSDKTVTGMSVEVNYAKECYISTDEGFDRYEKAAIAALNMSVSPIKSETVKGKVSRYVEITYQEKYGTPDPGTYNIMLIPKGPSTTYKPIAATVTLTDKPYATKTVIKDSYTLSNNEVKLEPKKKVTGETIIISSVKNIKNNNSSINGFASVFEFDGGSRDTLKVKEGVDISKVDAENMVGYVTYYIISKDGVPSAEKTVKVTIGK